jgi:hypothetical protein
MRLSAFLLLLLLLNDIVSCYDYTARSESHYALRLRYVDLVISIEVAVAVYCCCVTFHCIQLSNSAIPVKCSIA